MQKYGRVTVLAAVALLGAWAASAQTQTPAPAPAPASPGGVQKIGFVDLQRVMARSAAGVAAREQFERERATVQKEMDARTQELEKLGSEIEKKGPLMTEEVRREKQDLFERKRRDAARLADDFRRDLEKKEAALVQRVLGEFTGVIERLGKQRGYYLVVEKHRAAVLYADAAADLTDEVIRAYDQETNAKGKK